MLHLPTIFSVVIFLFVNISVSAQQIPDIFTDSSVREATALGEIDKVRELLGMSTPAEERFMNAVRNQDADEMRRILNLSAEEILFYVLNARDKQIRELPGGRLKASFSTTCRNLFFKMVGPEDDRF